eukprot:TRINITY_DN31433_c0_g1_i1.p1 TRINITY_DN31433_c0_g1~~TRINITY_DN31433_c0_g1_i1.p1  ORF type:complete len:402 (-),score=48.55 TRINITY_DN31433_c0_g1_i1:335-1540(-)
MAEVVPTVSNEKEEERQEQPSSHGMIEAALSVQRDFMETYGDSLEQMLSIGVYLVPVQEEAGEPAGFGSQAVYSAIDLFNLYRTVLLRAPSELPVTDASSSSSSLGDQPTLRLRGLRITYTLAAFTLRALRSIQVLLEMHACRKGGQQHALRVCMRIEVIKLVLKMVLRSTMPFSFYIDEDAIEDAEPPKLEQRRQLAHQQMLADASGGSIPSPASPQGSSPTTTQSQYVGRRTGRSLAALEVSGSTVGAVTPSAAPVAMPRVADGLFRDRSVASTQIAVAEFLHHCRPLLHLAMLHRRGHKSWAAWAVAFILERVSLALLVPHIKPKPDTRAATLELAEVRRRNNLTWWALARSPAFDKLLLGPCQVLDSILKRIPVINLFNIMELFLTLQPFYFTTSGS